LFDSGRFNKDHNYKRDSSSPFNVFIDDGEAKKEEGKSRYTRPYTQQGIPFCYIKLTKKVTHTDPFSKRGKS